jgi:hypothetical protein
MCALFSTSRGARQGFLGSVRVAQALDLLSAAEMKFSELENVAPSLQPSGAEKAFEALAEGDPVLVESLVTEDALRGFEVSNREVETNWSLARCAVAMGRYHAETGRWPARLDALVPDYLASVPSCAYSGQPLKIRKDRVWAYGWDRDDHGGIPSEVSVDGDVVWKVLPPLR